MGGKKKSELWRIILKLLYLDKYFGPSAFLSCPIQELVFLGEQRMLPAALSPHSVLNTLWGPFSSVFQHFAKNYIYPPTSLQPFQAEPMSSQRLEHVKCYIKMWNNITSQPYSQNLQCLKERGWGGSLQTGISKWGAEEGHSQQNSSHVQGLQTSLCLWALHGQRCWELSRPVHSTSASMQNIFNKYSLHGKYV